MIVYARLVVFGPATLAVLYLSLSAAFSVRDRWAERQAGR